MPIGTKEVGMGLVRFYQVAGEGPGVVDAVLPTLLEKAVAAGEKVVVVCPTAQRVGRVDEHLWTYKADSFLPHGVAGSGADDLVPVVIAGVEHVVDGRLPVALAGAEGVVEQCLGCPKVLYVFDSSAASVERSRGLWKALKGKAEVEYLAQEGGKWVGK
ncbi:MAG: DNA polymerase III subunit chi [Alphaproteobacteria bacterium]